MGNEKSHRPLAELIQDRLFRMNPLYWTEDHFEWVGCRFEESPAQSNGSALRLPSHEFSADHKSQEWVKALLENWGVDKRSRTMAKLLSKSQPSTFGKKRNLIPFSFANQEFFQPQFTLHYGNVEHVGGLVFSPPPMVGFYILDHHSETCQVCYDIKKHRDPAPGVRKIKGVPVQCPTGQWPYYPFLGCILLAIAQFQERIWGQQFNCLFYDTQLLAMNANETDYIHLYKAKFSDVLIQAIKSPNRATEYISWPNIKHSKIAFEPHATFQHRLLMALGGIS